VVWSAVDPQRWARKSINSEEWNTYGVCESDGTVGRACMFIVGGLNIMVLLITCWQKAHNLSGEFSESKQIGVALFSWLQLAVVSVPVLFVISDNNVQARLRDDWSDLWCLYIHAKMSICANNCKRRRGHTGEIFALFRWKSPYFGAALPRR